METKVCRTCGESKCIEEFQIQKKRYKGVLKCSVTRQCIKCCSLYKMEWAKRNPDKAKSAAKKYQQKIDPDKKRLYELRLMVKKPTWRKEKKKKERDNLYGTYIRKRLKQNGFKSELITPELIEVQRLIIKTKRLCKTLQN